MYKPVEVKPLSNYQLWLRYEDGTEGEVDLSDLAGKGVFARWNDRAVSGCISMTIILRTFMQSMEGIRL